MFDDNLPADSEQKIIEPPFSLANTSTSSSTLLHLCAGK